MKANLATLMMKIPALLFLFAVLMGCAGTASIQRTLEDRKGELAYVHDSVIVADKKAGTLTISGFTVADVLSADTSVENKSSSVLPLLLINTWKQEDQARLGYTQIANDYKQFLRERLVEEFKRNSFYELRNNDGDVAVDITIKKIEMSAPIYQQGTFFFLVFIFGGGSQTIAGPVDVTVNAEVRASRGGAVVLAKELQGSYRTNVLKGRNAILQDYTITMIEGVSLAVKKLNEKIVQEINTI
jgi:hypothetical protein